MKPESGGGVVTAPKPATPEHMKRNIGLGFDLFEAILDDVAILDEIPNGATVVLLPDDDQVLFDANIALGVNAARQGRDVLLRHVRTTPETHADAK